MLMQSIHKLTSQFIVVRTLSLSQFKKSTEFLLSIRSYSYQRLIKKNQLKKRLYQVDQNVAEDVLIFSNEKSGPYTLWPMFGLSQLLFFSIQAYNQYFPIRGLPDFPMKSQALQVIVQFQSTYNVLVGSCYLLLGIGIGVFSFYYPSRAIKNLWLLKGGQSIKVQTFGPLLRQQWKTLPIDEVSAELGRQQTNQLQLKFKGTKSVFMLDCFKGKLHEPKLFDYCVGLRREFK